MTNSTEAIKRRLEKDSMLNTFKSFIDRSTSLHERRRLSFMAKQLLTPDELRELNHYIIEFLDTEFEIKRIKKIYNSPFMFISHKRDWKKYNEKRKNLKDEKI
jgi:hypothetical protein